MRPARYSFAAAWLLGASWLGASSGIAIAQSPDGEPAEAAPQAEPTAAAPPVEPATETLPEVTSSYIKARALELPAPRYPRTAALQSEEGWVVLSYIVSPDGTIVEPMIEDSSGNEAFEQAAVDNLVNWRYEPARLDGEPVAQSMTKTRVVFVMDDQEPGARRSFVRRFREIGELIENGELEQVDGMITDLRYSEKQNLYEDAWFWWLNYRYLDASGDGESDEALDSLRRALGYEEDYLDADVLVAAAERLFVLQVRALDISAALNTFERLTSAKTAKRSDYYDVSVERLQQTVNTIEQFITGPQMLKVTGSIGQHDYWVHDLLRRSFSLDEIDGEVEVVDLRCERGTVQYHSVAEGNTWTVPESWGECGVYIKGTEGTTFEFYELPGA